MAGEPFQAAASVVPPLVLAMLFHATTPVTTSVLIVARRTGGLALGALGAVAVNVVACLVLVPLWGITGAAWATVLGFAYRAEDCRRRAARVGVTVRSVRGGATSTRGWPWPSPSPSSAWATSSSAARWPPWSSRAWVGVLAVILVVAGVTPWRGRRAGPA